jgi:hypothetical protein
MDHCTGIAVAHMVLGAFGAIATILVACINARGRRTEIKRMAFYATMLDNHDSWAKYQEYEATIKGKQKGA